MTEARLAPDLVEVDLPIADGIAEAEPGADRNPNVDQVLVSENLTDSGNALRFCAMHHDSARFVYERNEWLTYDGMRWVRDGLHSVHRKSYETARAISAAAEPLPDTRRRELQTHALKLEGAAAIRRMLELAAPRLQVRAADLDQPRHLLNCPNGTLDLRTLTLRVHDPGDLLTKVTAATYRPGARSELWDRIIKHAIPEEATRAYLQRVAGLTVDGSVMVNIMIVVHGPTRTSKGTVQDAIGSALGDYSITAGLEDFADRRPQPGRASPEIARLQGARMVSVYETSNRLRLNASLIKTLSGSDPVTARELYSRPFTYLPQFTLWLATNYRPGVPSDDDALWQRLREIPFSVQVPEERRDVTVRSQLGDPERHGAAILAWAIEGLRLYRESGLTTPSRVVQAGADYRVEMDPLVEFFGDCLVFDANATLANSDLSRSYAAWCEANSERPLSSKRLAAALSMKGCKRDRAKDPEGRSFRFWLGVRRA